MESIIIFRNLSGFSKWRPKTVHIADTLNYTLKMNILHIKYIILAITVLASAQHICAFDLKASEIKELSRLKTENLISKGEQAMNDGDTEEALKIFTVVCSRDDGTGDRELFCRAFETKGNILFEHENYHESMQAYLQALAIAEKEQFTGRLPLIYKNIGNIFSYIEDLDMGIFYYRKAIGAAEKANMPETLPTLYNNLLFSYYIKGDTDSVRNYYELCRDMKADRSPKSRYDLSLNQGLICEMEGDYDLAVGLFRKAASFARDSMNSILAEGAAISHIASVYERSNRPDSAIHYLNLNERLARENRFNSLLAETLRDLSRIYDSLGRKEEALAYKTRYLALSDSMVNRETLTLIKNSQALYEMSSKSDIIHSLHSKTLLQRDWIVAMFIIMAGAICFLTVLWRQKRLLSRAYADLYERNSSLIEAETRYTSRIQNLESALQENADLKMEEETPETDTEKTGEEPEAERPAAHTETPATNSRRLLYNKEQRDALLSKINNLMESSDCYCQPDFNIDRLASMVGSNTRYVSEVINDEYKMNFRSYLNKYRVKEAMRRLEDTEKYGNYTIKAVAESVGYKSQATFISVFTKDTGLKPSLYQQLARKKHERND